VHVPGNNEEDIMNCKALVAFFVAGMVAAPLSALAQKYPDKPIHVILPYASGSSGDLTGRTVLDRVSKGLGQPIVFENRGGASGAIGTEYVRRAAPDGYTILYHTNSSIVNQVTKPNQIDMLTAFKPISTVVFGAMGVFIHPSIPANTLGEFLGYARANQGKLNFGSSGLGTQTHLYGVLFNKSAGLDMTHIPYQGGGPMMAGAAGGQFQLMLIDAFTAKPLADAGKLKMLAVATEQRMSQLPNMPTVNEAGLPGYIAKLWFGYFAPLGTPDSVITVLNTEINNALRDPGVRKILTDNGYEVRGGSPADFKRVLDRELDMWNQAIKAAGIAPGSLP